MGYNIDLMNPNPPLQANRIVPGQDPGTIWIPGAGWQRFTDWTENPIWDSEILPVAITAGMTFNYFASLNFTTGAALKTKLFTSMTQPGQLPKGWRAIVYGIHFMQRPGTPWDDTAQVIGGGYMEFITQQQKIEREGPLWAFPSPYGLTGFISQVALAPVEKSAPNNGVPSANDVGRSVIVDLVDQMTFMARIRFDNAINLSSGAQQIFYAVLRAYINKPLR